MMNYAAFLIALLSDFQAQQLTQLADGLPPLQTFLTFPLFAGRSAS